MAAKEKKAPLMKLNTPLGVAKFPWLNTPDTRFDDAGVYKVDLVLPEDDPKVQALIGKIKKVYEEFRATLPAPKNKKEPESYGYSPDYDAEGNETGYLVFKLKAKASYQNDKQEVVELPAPAKFDAKLQKIPDDTPIWSGSTMIANFSPSPYFQGKNCGVTLRLNAVQILELKTRGTGSASDYGFGEEEGYSQTSEADEAMSSTTVDDEDF